MLNMFVCIFRVLATPDPRGFMGRVVNIDPSPEEIDDIHQHLTPPGNQDNSRGQFAIIIRNLNL